MSSDQPQPQSQSQSYGKINTAGDPKQVLANERTFLEWFKMAISLAGVASALLMYTTDLGGGGNGNGNGASPVAPNLPGSGKLGGKGKGGGGSTFMGIPTGMGKISGGQDEVEAGTKAELATRAAQRVGLILMPVAILFAGYAVGLYAWRRAKIHDRKVQNIQVSYGPQILTVILMLALSVIFITEIAQNGLF